MGDDKACRISSGRNEFVDVFTAYLTPLFLAVLTDRNVDLLAVNRLDVTDHVWPGSGCRTLSRATMRRNAAVASVAEMTGIVTENSVVVSVPVHVVPLD